MLCLTLLLAEYQWELLRMCEVHTRAQLSCQSQRSETSVALKALVLLSQSQTRTCSDFPHAF